MGRKLALLAGVQDFDHPAIHDLPGVEGDLRALQAALVDPEGAAFDDVAVLGPNQQPRVDGVTLRSHFESFLRSGEPAVRLLYVACHGLVDGQGELILLPSDFDPQQPNTSGIAASFLGACLQGRTESPTIILLDCCFADAGAWSLFQARTSVFRFPQDYQPEYALVAAARHDQPALDGGFAPILAEAFRNVDPAPGDIAVGMERLYDYVAVRLRERHLQVSRLWQSRTVAFPIGRRTSGLRATERAVSDLYSTLPSDRSLERPPAGVLGLSFIERHKLPQGFTVRTGLKVLEGEPERRQVERALDDLRTAVGEDQVDNAMLILTAATEFEGLSSERVLVRSFADFRVSCLPIIRYVEREVEAYENDTESPHKSGSYVSVYAHVAGMPESFRLDSYILDWAKDRGGVNILTILGEFGAGKTTTAREVFWLQAKRYLRNPVTERLPIFISLREFKSLDMPTLVGRSLAGGGEAVESQFAAVSRMNDSGQVLWILDGFDEMAVRVTEPLMHANFAEILRLAVDRAAIVLTCRTAFFKSREEIEDVLKGTELHQQLVDEAAGRYRILHVDPFREDEIEQFVRMRLGRDPSRDPEAFLSDLRGRRELMDLAARPILLEMIVLTLPQLIESGSKLNRANVYRSYTGKLVKRDTWRFTVKVEEERIQFCEALAWQFFATGSYQIAYRELPEFIKRFFPEAARTAEEFEALSTAIRSTAFLALEEQSNRFAFAHKSFQEYFAAAHVVRELADGKREAIGTKVLSAEIARFGGELLAEAPPALKAANGIAEAARFSFGYFWRSYLRPRILPLRRRANTPLIHRSRLDLLSRLATPGLLLLIVTVVFISAFDLQEGEVSRAWLLSVPVTFLGLITTYLGEYCWRVWRRREGNPIERFNALALVHYSGRPVEVRDLEDVAAVLPDRQAREVAALLRAIQYPDAAAAPEPEATPEAGMPASPPGLSWQCLWAILAALAIWSIGWTLPLSDSFFDIWDIRLGRWAGAGAIATMTAATLGGATLRGRPVVKAIRMLAVGCLGAIVGCLSAFAVPLLGIVCSVIVTYRRVSRRERWSLVLGSVVYVGASAIGLTLLRDDAAPLMLMGAISGLLGGLAAAVAARGLGSKLWLRLASVWSCVGAIGSAAGWLGPLYAVRSLESPPFFGDEKFFYFTIRLILLVAPILTWAVTLALTVWASLLRREKATPWAGLTARLTGPIAVLPPA